MISSKKLAISLGAISFLSLLLFTLFNSHPIFWDEEYYLSNISRYQELGFSYEFFRGFKGPAGPTHTLVYLVPTKLFNYSVPYIRLINIILLAFSVQLIYLIIKKVYGEKLNNVFAKVVGVLSVPMVFVISGLVLTEIPAIFFLLLTIYLLVDTLFNKSFLIKFSYLRMLIAGVCFGLSILGRQPFLLLIIPLFLLFYHSGRFLIKEYVLFGLGALMLILPVFFIWGGVLPKTGGEIATRSVIEPLHLLLAGGYAFVVFLFLLPEWVYFFTNKKVLVVGVALTSVLLMLNIYLKITAFAPMRTVAITNLPEGLFNLYQYSLPVILAVLGLFLAFVLLRRLWINRNDLFYGFSVLSLMLIVATSLFVTHQFSSRYVVQALPFFIFISVLEMRLSKMELVARLIGVVIGMMSLISFFSV